MRFLIFAFLVTMSIQLNGQEVAILKYNGGGDWYANPTAVPNLIAFTNENCNTSIVENPLSVTADSDEIYNYPIIFMTGHGNVVFSKEDQENLKNYLISGGFLHISDNFGLDKYIRRELKNLFPSLFRDKRKSEIIFHLDFEINENWKLVSE